MLSSRWEGEPIALLEAMTFGLPCVASATAGARELIDGAGRLVPIDVETRPKSAQLFLQRPLTGNHEGCVAAR
ncbi:MAG: glycosyltransferase [Myxococcota bacterium]